ARQNYHLDTLDIVGIEREQLLHEPERDPRLRGLLETIVLQSHVSVVVGALEDGVLFFEIEQRPRADRDDQLIGRCGHRHAESIEARRRRCAIRAEGPPRGANYSPSGAAQRPNWSMRPQAWGAHYSRRRAAPRRELLPLGGQRSGKAASVGAQTTPRAFSRVRARGAPSGSRRRPTRGG